MTSWNLPTEKNKTDCLDGEQAQSELKTDVAVLTVKFRWSFSWGTI